MAETATKTRRKGAKTIAREYIEAIAGRDLDRAVAMWRPGCIGHFHGIADFPDWEMTVVDATGSGDRAAVRWHAKATFDGDSRFQGFAPNGARIEIEGCDMLSIEDGRIVENHAYTNGAELAQQIGVLPQPGSLGERLLTGAANARTAASRAVADLRARRRR
jgi:predicted ester cyclase